MLVKSYRTQGTIKGRREHGSETTCAHVAVYNTAVRKLENDDLMKLKKRDFHISITTFPNCLFRQRGRGMTSVELL